MYAMPHTPMGRRALWLLLPVLLYVLFPVYRLIDLVIPDSWRAVRIAIAVAVIGLALASVVAAALAIFRDKERSVVLIVAATLTFLLLVGIALGEALGGH